MRTTRLDCGCRYEVGDRERWTEFCPTHLAEHDELRRRWAHERMARIVSDTCANGGERREREAYLKWLRGG